MKSLFVSRFLLLLAASAQAQISTAMPVPDTGNTAQDFALTSAGKATLPHVFAAADPFAPANSAPASPAPHPGPALVEEPAAAGPAAPSPSPRFVYGGRDDYRGQLGIALASFRFRSSVFVSHEL